MDLQYQHSYCFHFMNKEHQAVNTNQTQTKLNLSTDEILELQSGHTFQLSSALYSITEHIIYVIFGFSLIKTMNYVES